MINVLFLKRIFQNKMVWLSVLTAILLLMCTVVYRDDLSGKTYTFFSLFYDREVQEALQGGMISLYALFTGVDAGYLWMFCPILAGIPGVINNRTERLVIFRSSKNGYCFSKLFSTLFAGGLILLFAYVGFLVICMAVAGEFFWDGFVTKKLFSTFFFGMYSALPGVLLLEFVRNKYLILCVPFVLNYLYFLFLGPALPYQINSYVSPQSYQILFFYDSKTIAIILGVFAVLLLGCAGLKRMLLERRCDCGQ